MGNGIAHVFAQHGFTVTLTDINAASLAKALQTIEKNAERQLNKGTITPEIKAQLFRQLSTTTSLPEAVQNADLVIEAATENRAVKLDIFRQLDDAVPSTAILATNTSSISITAIAAAIRRPGKVIGMQSFGESAPGGAVMKHFGFTPEKVIETVEALL